MQVNFININNDDSISNNEIKDYTKYIDNNNMDFLNINQNHNNLHETYGKLSLAKKHLSATKIYDPKKIDLSSKYIFLMFKYL